MLMFAMKNMAHRTWNVAFQPIIATPLRISLVQYVARASIQHMAGAPNKD